MRGRKKNFAVFITENGDKVEVEMWEHVYSIVDGGLVPAYKAKPDQPVNLPTFEGVQALRDERNYDRTTRVGKE